MLTRNGEALPIGHRGYVLLETLLDAQGVPVDKATLMERVWPGMIVEESNLSVQIATLRRQLGGNAEALIVTVPRVGYRLVAPAAPEKTSAAGPPMLAVLPFANHSNEAAQGYFADGVVDDIITTLSRFKNFGVLSRGSTFALRDQPGDRRVAAADMGARYVLEGSVRLFADRVRVTAQLVDAGTGAHLWAEKFDGEAGDIFEFQDRITEAVVGVIEPEIRKAEIERARRKPPNSLEAYDFFLRALPLVYGMDIDDYAEALRLLEQAITLDPNFAVAIGYAAWTAEKLGVLASDPTDSRALELAHLAIDRGRDDPFVALLAGWVLLAVGNDQLGIEMVRRGLAANPNNLVALNLGGITNLKAGDLDAANECYARAYRLSPGAPDAFWTLTGLGWVEVQRGNDAAALEWFDRSLATGNEWPFTLLGIVAASALSGQQERAKGALARRRRIAPQWSTEVLMKGPQGMGFARLREGLRLALTFAA
jgi:TolB-like protein